MEPKWGHIQDLTVDDVIHAHQYPFSSAVIFEEPFVLNDDLILPLRFITGRKRQWKPNRATLKRLIEAFQKTLGCVLYSGRCRKKEAQK